MRKGSLSLSVNAIVVFVLAFAMLGFGLLIINNLREQGTGALDKAFDINKFDTPPDNRNPVVISDALRLKKTGSKTVGIGVYNNAQGDLPSTTVPKIIKCSTGLDPTSSAIGIEALARGIPVSESYAYKVNVKTNSAPEGSYICEIGVREPVSDNTITISEQFEVTISS